MRPVVLCFLDSVVHFTMALRCFLAIKHPSMLRYIIYVIVNAIEFAASKGWNFIWLESDSKIYSFNLSYELQFQATIAAVHQMVKLFELNSWFHFTCLYIFQEGNKSLTNFGVMFNVYWVMKWSILLFLLVKECLRVPGAKIYVYNISIESHFIFQRENLVAVGIQASFSFLFFF